MIKTLEETSFLLDFFEGPLDLLLYLVQKEEVNISQVTLQSITEQIREHLLNASGASKVDAGAEFLALASTMLMMKSHALLPQTGAIPEAEALNPQFDWVHQLIEYQRFKEIAKQLAGKEKQQEAYYHRGNHLPDEPEPQTTGLALVSLSELAGLFQEIMKKAPAAGKNLLQDDVWKVSDQIIILQNLLEDRKEILFTLLFAPDKCCEELIVLFLALLELMKQQKAAVVRPPSNEKIYLVVLHETRS